MTNSNVFLLGLVCSLLLFIVAPSHAASGTDVCPKTKNPSFCHSVLKSAGSPDLKGLATHVLSLAHKNAAESVSLAKSLAGKATDPQLKGRYNSCAKNFDEAIGNIERAEKNLASGDYNGVNLAASAVMSTVDDCQANFEKGPADTSALPNNGKVVDDICSIILVISNLLPQSV